jgi:hypothetical protein
MFHKNKLGKTPFITVNYDIIHLAKTLVIALPITVEAEWVKGHFTAVKKTVQEELNIIADDLAATYTLHSHPCHQPSQLPPPAYAVRLLYGGSVITSRLYSTLSTSLNTTLIINHIIKKTNLNCRTFNMVEDLNGKTHPTTHQHK